MDGLPAVSADHPNQTLREDAIESRHEVVRVDPIFRNRPSYIDNIIRCTVVKTRWPVRAVDRDLSRFNIANFSNHDLVGIVTQN